MTTRTTKKTPTAKEPLRFRNTEEQSTWEQAFARFYDYSFRMYLNDGMSPEQLGTSAVQSADTYILLRRKRIEGVL